MHHFLFGKAKARDSGNIGLRDHTFSITFVLITFEINLKFGAFATTWTLD
jgi:hypothetical protein